MPPRRVDRHRGVQHGDQRQARRAQRRQPVQPEHGQVGQRHQGPAREAGSGGERGRGRRGPGRQPDDRPGRRQDVQERQPGHGPGQQPGGVPELDVGRPGHHLPQVGEPRVRANAHHRGGQPEPAAPALALDQLAQGHVVDAGAADRGQPAGSLQGLAAYEHAAAGGRRRPRPRRVDPRERVQLGEEVHERGDDDPFPPGRRPQQRHLGNQVPVVLLGRAHQGPQRAGLPGDVGVGEQHVPRPGTAVTGRGETLGHGPHLAGPAGRQRGAGHHPQGPPGGPRRLCSFPGSSPGSFPGSSPAESGRDLGRAVRAAVVDHDDRQRAGIVLAEQRGKRGRQHRGFVAGRDDRRHVRPPGRLTRGTRRGRGWNRECREPLAGPPVSAVPDDQVGPGDRGRGARDTQRQHPGSLSQGGSRRRLRPGRPHLHGLPGRWHGPAWRDYATRR
jgi:hypothetical protein